MLHVIHQQLSKETSRLYRPGFSEYSKYCISIPSTSDIRPVIFLGKEQCFWEASKVSWAMLLRISWPHLSTSLTHGIERALNIYIYIYP